MTLGEFKNRIAKRFETYPENIIVEIDKKQFKHSIEEDKLSLSNDLGMDESKMVRIEFKIIPRKY